MLPVAGQLYKPWPCWRNCLGFCNNAATTSGTIKRSAFTQAQSYFRQVKKILDFVSKKCTLTSEGVPFQFQNWRLWTWLDDTASRCHETPDSKLSSSIPLIPLFRAFVSINHITLVFLSLHGWVAEGICKQDIRKQRVQDRLHLMKACSYDQLWEDVMTAGPDILGMYQRSNRAPPLLWFPTAEPYAACAQEKSIFHKCLDIARPWFQFNLEVAIGFLNLRFTGPT